MRIKVLAAAAAAALVACLTAGSAGAASFGTNLVLNGDAEAGTGVPAGFSTTGDLVVRSYTDGAGYPVAGDPGVSEGGQSFFSGGDNDTMSTASQMIDLSSLASAIDGGGVSYTLAALLGGFASQNDNSVLSVLFEGAGGTNLGTGEIGPVLAADRANATGLLARSASGLVPVGTRSVDLVLTATRLEGTANDGYADNLSFVLGVPLVSGAPEPGSWALMLGGIGLLGGVLRLGHPARQRRSTALPAA